MIKKIWVLRFIYFFFGTLNFVFNEFIKLCAINIEYDNPGGFFNEKIKENKKMYIMPDYSG